MFYNSILKSNRRDRQRNISDTVNPGNSREHVNLRKGWRDWGGIPEEIFLKLSLKSPLRGERVGRGGGAVGYVP